MPCPHKPTAKGGEQDRCKGNRTSWHLMTIPRCEKTPAELEIAFESWYVVLEASQEILDVDLRKSLLPAQVDVPGSGQVDEIVRCEVHLVLLAVSGEECVGLCVPLSRPGSHT